MIDPGSIAAITAGSNILGTVMTNNANAQNIKNANSTNLDIAREQMEFQERMSNSAYQRAVVVMQNDLGQAIVICATLSVMLLFAGSSFRLFLSILLAGAVGAIS